MYLVQALKAAQFPTTAKAPSEVNWAANQYRIVDDSIIERIQQHSTVFSVIAGPDEVLVIQALVDLATVNTNDIRGAAGDFRHIVQAGAPAASAQATLAMASAGANNDLTFTAVAYGSAGNGLKVVIVQATAPNTSLGVAVTGTVGTDWLATITLPADADGVAVAKTATQVKTAWDAVAGAVGVATVAVEGTGAGNVAAHSVGTFANGTGVGIGTAGPGSKLTDVTNAKEYLNTGTKAAPVWTQLAFVA